MHLYSWANTVMDPSFLTGVYAGQDISCRSTQDSESRAANGAGEQSAVSVEQRDPPSASNQLASDNPQTRRVNGPVQNGQLRDEDGRADFQQSGAPPRKRGLEDALPIFDLVTAASAPATLTFEYTGAPLPPNESERRTALCGLEAYKTRTDPEERFDDITKLVSNNIYYSRLAL